MSVLVACVIVTEVSLRPLRGLVACVIVTEVSLRPLRGLVACVIVTEEQEAFERAGSMCHSD